MIGLLSATLLTGAAMGGVVDATGSGEWMTVYPTITDADTALVGLNKTVTAADGTTDTVAGIILRGGGAGSVLNINAGSSITVGASQIKAGSNNNTKGYLNINGGSLSSSSDLLLGGNGANVYGELNVNSGSYSSTANLVLGGTTYDSGPAGVANLSGGSVDVVNWQVGGAGAGLLNVSGGTHTGTADLMDGASGGQVLISGGELAINRVLLDGATGVSISGGKLVITGTNNNRLDLSGGAGLNISDAGVLQWNFGNKWQDGSTVDLLIGSGEITFDAGENSIMLYADFDNSWTDGDGDILYAKSDGGSTYFWVAIPEPATLGLISAFGGGMLFIRRRFLI
ncbi:hypothetical protein PDESU_01853 [Pontiella desulfatans]|uniref:PEP-CTERM protein-sorting domain-containing protein n=2 Tax=Pontiella desulfatans TaxID=2750659 RepID=A0A6C2U096_PONDE|nr:hypothetical protein PDESU_01853 [Pontiella desulfatans]